MVEDHAIIVQTPANMRRLLALLRSIVHAILTHNQPKNIISQPLIRDLPRPYDGLGSGLLAKFSSRSPGVCVLDGETILVELCGVRSDQAREALTGRINNIQITVGTIIPAQANVGTRRLRVCGIHLD